MDSLDFSNCFPHPEGEELSLRGNFLAFDYVWFDQGRSLRAGTCVLRNTAQTRERSLNRWATYGRICVSVSGC